MILLFKIPGRSYEEGTIHEQQGMQIVNFSFVTNVEEEYSLCIHS